MGIGQLTSSATAPTGFRLMRTSTRFGWHGWRADARSRSRSRDVRGGGEYGEEWYRAGYKLTKQHTIDDFIASAQYLIANKYTNPHRLSGEGTSAGGILIGGAITQ